MGTIFQTSIVARISRCWSDCLCEETGVLLNQPSLTTESSEQSVCRTTAANIEDFLYCSDAPERNNFRFCEDEGVAVSLTGRLEGDCSALDGAIIEFWHANPRRL